MKNYVKIVSVLWLGLFISNTAWAQRVTPPTTVIPSTTSVPSYLPFFQRPDGSFVYPQVDANGNLYVTGSGGSGGGNNAAGPTNSAVPSYGDFIAFMNSSGNLTGVASGSPLPVTGTLTVVPTAVNPSAPAGSLTLVSGGNSQLLASAGSATNGCSIYNPTTPAQQNVSNIESVFINYTGNAATLSSGGQSQEILPGQTFNCPPGDQKAIYWTAATTGHKITGVVW